MCQSTRFGYKNFSAGGIQGRSAPYCKFGTTLISRKVLEKAEIKNTIRYCEVLALRIKISPVGGVKGA